MQAIIIFNNPIENNCKIKKLNSIYKKYFLLNHLNINIKYATLFLIYFYIIISNTSKNIIFLKFKYIYESVFDKEFLSQLNDYELILFTNILNKFKILYILYEDENSQIYNNLFKNLINKKIFKNKKELNNYINNINNKITNIKYSNKIYISGVSGVGKTTFIKNYLEKYKNTTNPFCDYINLISMYPYLNNKYNNSIKEALYVLAFFAEDFNSLCKYIDRSPIDSILYHYIFDKMNNKFDDDEFKKFCILLKKINFKILCFIPNDSYKCLKTIKERNNNIDIYKKEYIDNQIYIFKKFYSNSYFMHLFGIDNPKYINLIVNAFNIYF